MIRIVIKIRIRKTSMFMCYTSKRKDVSVLFIRNNAEENEGKEKKTISYDTVVNNEKSKTCSFIS